MSARYLVYTIVIASCFQVCQVALDTWYTFGSKCYLLSTYDNDFHIIKNDCQNNHGGYLMAIKTAHELKFIQEKMAGVPDHMEFFIGLEVNTSLTGKAFTWRDGSSPLPEIWAAGYPENDEDNVCAALVYTSSQNQWLVQDWRPQDDAFYVCEKSATLQSTTSWVSRPDFRSWKSYSDKVSAFDIDNMCVTRTRRAPSVITCAKICYDVSCDMFTFEQPSNTCHTFMTRTGPCTTMPYNGAFKYFKIDYGQRFACS